MSIRLVAIGDTHSYVLEDLPEEMMRAIQQADWLIHVGDYTSKDILGGLMALKGKRFRGVYGNADPQAIRDRVPTKDILEVEGKRIGIIHPAEGGGGHDIEQRVMAEFKNDSVDAIVYGHTHDAKVSRLGGLLLVSPGKGYLEKGSYFGPPTSMAVLTVGEDIKAEIRKISR